MVLESEMHWELALAAVLVLLALQLVHLKVAQLEVYLERPMVEMNWDKHLAYWVNMMVQTMDLQSDILTEQRLADMLEQMLDLPLVLPLELTLV